MIAPGIAVVNTSSVVTDADVERMVEACSIQLARDVCPAWSRLPIAVSFAADPKTIPLGVPVVQIADDADAPEALAWHSETEDDRIIGRVGAKTCIDNGGGILTGGSSVASALSHEIVEMALDPMINLWAQRPSGDLVAVEGCDPVQDLSYQIGGVDVSDFVFPAWLDPEATSQEFEVKIAGKPVQARSPAFDRMGVLTAPMTRTPGGYMVILGSDGSTTQEGERAAWKPITGRGNIRRLGAARVAR